MKYGLLLIAILLGACAQEEFRGSMATVDEPVEITQVTVHHPVGGKLYVDEDRC